jgi:hypothetical protein
MEIRSITYFLHPGYPLHAPRIKAAGKFLQAAQQAFEAVGTTVQTTRLATVPFPSLKAGLSLPVLLRFAQELEQAAGAASIDYISLGPALPQFPRSYTWLPELLAETKNTFAAGVIAGPDIGISLPAVHACGEVIAALAGQEANGFGNLYFAALANVPPGAPFFPAAYHQGEQPMFALAMQAADLAVEVFSQTDNLADARRRLVEQIEAQAQKLTAVAEKLAADHQMAFRGLDFTLSPFPTPENSLGTALEALGVSAVGLQGSLAAAAILASTLDQANYLRTGFNGLMLPVLEDACLAERAADGSLAVNDLLLYSAVCGTGLDTIPLPGSTPAEHISALLLDLAALAMRLDKPLTARLMPIPGKSAGEATGFDFSYFANSRVMNLHARNLSGKLAAEETFPLQSRPVSPKSN